MRLRPRNLREHPEEAAAAPQAVAAAASHQDNPLAAAAVEVRQTAVEQTPAARQTAAAAVHAEVAQNHRRYEELQWATDQVAVEETQEVLLGIGLA